MVVTAAGPARGRHRRSRCSSAARRSRASSPRPRIAAELRRRLHLRQGRHGRPGAGQPALLRGDPRRARRALRREQAALAGAPSRPRRRRRARRAAPITRARGRPRSRPPPDLDRHVCASCRSTTSGSTSIRRCSTASTWACKGSVQRLLEEGDPKARELQEVMEGLKTEAVREGSSRRGASGGSSGRGRRRRPHPLRRRAGGGRALRLSAPAGGERPVPAPTTSAGATTTSRCSPSPAARACASGWTRPRSDGEYLSSTPAALALETAEALAEWLHARLRTLWGSPIPPELTIEDKLNAHYRGKRCRSATRPAPTSPTSRALACCAPRRSASTSPKAS